MAETLHSIAIKAELYPWLEQQWSFFIEQHQQQRLPHALILSGKQGLGKQALALTMAKYLLCASPAEQACENCRHCSLLKAGYHPDLWFIAPEEGSHVIKIEQIRKLTAGLQQTAAAAEYQVAIITPAENMNASAANALLKSLEEPQGNTVFILVANQPYKLPATILSRSQILSCTNHKETAAISWLQKNIREPKQVSFLYKVSQGAPLQALSFEEQGYLDQRNTLLKHLSSLDNATNDPVSIAESYIKQDNWLWVDIFQLVLNDLLKRSQQCEAAYLTNADMATQLDKYLEQHTLQGLLIVQKKIDEFNPLRQQSANMQLLCADLFIAWTDSKQA